MSIAVELTSLLSPVVSDMGFVLEDLKVTSFGKRKLIAVIVDGESKNPNLDEVAGISRVISDLLDKSKNLGDQPFTLEVTTPGVDRPLHLPRHWKKNVGRLAEIELLDGTQFSGRINAVDGDKVQIEEQVFILDSIKCGKIQIEFNRKDLR